MQRFPIDGSEKKLFQKKWSFKERKHSVFQKREREKRFFQKRQIGKREKVSLQEIGQWPKWMICKTRTSAQTLFINEVKQFKDVLYLFCWKIAEIFIRQSWTNCWIEYCMGVSPPYYNRYQRKNKKQKTSHSVRERNTMQVTFKCLGLRLAERKKYKQLAHPCRYIWFSGLRWLLFTWHLHEKCKEKTTLGLTALYSSPWSRLQELHTVVSFVGRYTPGNVDAACV